MNSRLVSLNHILLSAHSEKKKHSKPLSVYEREEKTKYENQPISWINSILKNALLLVEVSCDIFKLMIHKILKLHLVVYLLKRNNDELMNKIWNLFPTNHSQLLKHQPQISSTSPTWS